MIRRLQLLLLRLYRRLPTTGRRFVVRRLAPTFTVGAMGIIERANSDLLLVRHSYRKRWGVPGGLLKGGETPEEALRREVREEVALEVELFGEPAVVVDPPGRRVDIVFRAGAVDDGHLDSVRPTSPEIIEVRWFPADELPDLQFETAGALMALTRAANVPEAWSRADATPLPSASIRRAR